MLKTKNKLLLAAILIAAAIPAYSQSYMCLPCPEGTGNNGKNKECILTDDLNYEKNPFIKLEKAETSSVNLDRGCYKIELVGGGGGGGNSTLYPYTGGGGGSGYRESITFCTQGVNIDYTVGKGGTGAHQEKTNGYWGWNKQVPAKAGSPTSLNEFSTPIFFNNSHQTSFSISGGGAGGNVQYIDTGDNNSGNTIYRYDDGLGGIGYQNGSKGDCAGHGGGPNGGKSSCGAAGTDGKLGGGGGGGDDYSSKFGGNGGDGYIYIYKVI